MHQNPKGKWFMAGRNFAGLRSVEACHVAHERRGVPFQEMTVIPHVHVAHGLPVRLPYRMFIRIGDRRIEKVDDF